MSNSQPTKPPKVTGFRKSIYISLGILFVGLAAVGVALPGLPTTPFLLLASFFFVRSSPRFHTMLLRSRIFGPFLRDWYEKRAIRPGVKYTTLVLIPTMIGISAYFAQFSWPVLAVVIVLGLVGITVVMRLPVIRPEQKTNPPLPKLANPPTDNVREEIASVKCG